VTGDALGWSQLPAMALVGRVSDLTGDVTNDQVEDLTYHEHITSAGLTNQTNGNIRLHRQTASVADSTTRVVYPTTFP
jgi:hypothetical protein